MTLSDPYEWVDTRFLDWRLFKFLSAELAEIDTRDPFYTMENELPVMEGEQTIETPDGLLEAPPHVRYLRAYIERNREILDETGLSILSFLLEGEMTFYLEEMGVDSRAPGFGFRFRKNGTIIHSTFPLKGSTNRASVQ